jgi:hypothetical protein
VLQWRRRGGTLWLRHLEVSVSSCLSQLRLWLLVVKEIRRLSAWVVEVDVRQEAASIPLCV